MQAVTRYSLIHPNDKNQRAILARDGRALGVEVDGTIMEAQFELHDGSGLIWLTDNSPHDEGLHIYLLGRDDAVKDALEAGADFSAGVVKIKDGGEDWVDFEFFLNRSVYRLEVTRKAGFQLWLPAGWKYKNLLRAHRLVVREVSKGGA